MRRFADYISLGGNRECGFAIRRDAPEADASDIQVVSYDRLFAEFRLADGEACASVRAFAGAD